MYTENPGKDALLFAKAFLSNQLARFAPKLYVNLTRQTGRGEGEEDPLQVANYFIKCFCDYRDQIGLNEAQFRECLRGKVVLEYGPGDILGVALLMYAYGAERVCCVDRFPLTRLSTKNIDVYRHLLDSLAADERKRGENAFKQGGNPGSGFNANAIAYKVTKDGLSGASGEYDLIISRAVLEHVNDIRQTMLDIKRSMRSRGISIHQVDLRSHGLDRYTEFDFLTWPDTIYKLMYSHKGFPNRWRVDKYRDLAEGANLRVKNLKPTGRVEQEQLDIVRPKLAKTLGRVAPEDLSWTGFWIVLDHPAPTMVDQ
jgi:hypothetical protein